LEETNFVAKHQLGFKGYQVM